MGPDARRDDETMFAPILEEEQRRRRADFAAILRTDGQLRAISALRLVDDGHRIAILIAP